MSKKYEEIGSARISFKIILKWSLFGLLGVLLAFLIGYVSFVLRL